MILRHWIPRDVISKFFIGHGLFSAITSWAGRNNIFGSISAAFASRHFMLSLKGYVGRSTIGTRIMILFKYFMPLFNGQRIRKITDSCYSSSFIVVSSFWIILTVITLIFQKFFTIILVVFLLVNLFPILSFGSLIPYFIKLSNVIALFKSSIFLKFGMIRFKIKFLVAPIANTKGIMLCLFLTICTNKNLLSSLFSTLLDEAIPAKMMLCSVRSRFSTFLAGCHLILLKTFSPCKYIAVT